MRFMLVFAALAACFSLDVWATAEDNLRPQISRSRTRLEVDRWKFDDYRYRLDSRRRDAIATRRAYNASKGPHVYRTAIAVPMPITPVIGIEAGWVRQPPIGSSIRRTTVVRTPTLLDRLIGIHNY